MLKIYGEEKSNDEVVSFILEHVAGVKNSKHHRYHSIISMVPTGKKILDYGCGWGYYSVAMAQKGNVVEAIDLSRNEIDICKLVWGNQENVSFQNKGIQEYENETFDCVTSIQVIEHVHNAGNYLAEINRVLKEEGQLIISLPNVINPRFILGLMRSNLEEKLVRLSQEFLDNYDKTHHHINAWDPTHFVVFCASLGFLLEKYIPAEGVAFPFKKPFNPYVQIKNKRLRNLSYSMVFSFRKVHETASISLND